VRGVDPKGTWQAVREQGALAKCVVTCLLEDRQRAVWVGTIGEGLHQVIPRRVEMALLPPEASSAALTGVCPSSDGSLWLATSGKGICRWRDGQWIRYGLPEGLPSEDITSITQDAHGEIWAGTSLGVARLQESHFVVVPALGGSTLAFFNDREGKLWLGNSSQLVCLRDGTNLTTYSAFDRRTLDIRGIAEDQGGMIWVAAFRSGLWQVQGAELVPVGARIGLSRSDVRSALCDDEGVLWIGTLYGGLFRWDGKRLQHYLMLDGFPDDSIIGLHTDNAGILWMSSNNGIFGCSRRNLADYERGKSPKLSCWQLGLAEGLANRGCSGGGQPVIAGAADGRLWVANMVGAAGFQPALITGQRTPVNILVESVLADGVELPRQDTGFRASTSSRRFEIRYTVPELGSPKLLHFRHRLDGLDPDWVDAGAERSASYSKLLPGNYRFRVMVSGGDGQWHEKSQPLAFEVIPQIWERRWLQVLALTLFISGIGASIARSQRKKLQLRLERLEMQHAVEKERIRIARDIHDQLGAGLTQIAMMSESRQVEPGNPQRLREQMTRIAEKARSAAQALNQIVWALNPGNDNLPQLLDHLCMFSEELCESAGLRCWHEVPTGLAAAPLPVEFRHSMVLAVREALNNVIKHASATEAWLRVSLAANLLRIEIEDNGRGFDMAAQVSGNGLSNLRARLEQLGGHAEIHSRIGKGTRVVLTARFDSDTDSRAV
jgi:signal transduction histidine kinase/ligand-binding sensor domain-containing protein